MPRLGFRPYWGGIISHHPDGVFSPAGGDGFIHHGDRPTFAAIWTTVGLGLLWQFNLWPFKDLPNRPRESLHR
ncbi:MAG UNVERIFIED_CONTAM: hypothetical protein LVR29_18385 [Microcystis novacekii LVE1205-3]|jgi:hypothetical protein